MLLKCYYYYYYYVIIIIIIIVKGRKSDVREKEKFSQLRSTVQSRHNGIIRKGSMTSSKKKGGSMTSPEKKMEF